MSNSNVVLHPTARWAELKRIYDVERHHAGKMREQWPAIAAHMAALREQFKADQEFGAMLTYHGIEYDRNDRAAFVWMGMLAPELLKEAMCISNSTSPRYFRIEVMDHDAERFSTEPVSLRSETAESISTPSANPAQTPVDPELSALFSEMGIDVSSSAPTATEEAPVTKEKKKKSTANEIREKVVAYFSHRSGKTVARKFKRPALERIAAWIDDGTLVGQCPTVFSSNLTARFVIHDLPIGPMREMARRTPALNVEDVSKSAQVNKFLDEVPMLARMRDECTDGKYLKWWNENRYPVVATSAPAAAPKVEGLDLSAFQKPAEQTFMADPDEGEIIVCGKKLWPVENPRYEYHLLWGMAHLVDVLNNTLKTTKGFNDSKGRSLYISRLSQWIERAGPKTARAFRDVSQAYSANPAAESFTIPGKKVRSSD